MKIAMAKEIVRICKILHEKNFIAAADGNVSYKIADDRYLITPSGKHKGFMEPSDIVEIDGSGKVLSGGTPSSEYKLHLAVYQNSKDAKCVVHAHPSCAVAWSIAMPKMEYLPAKALPEVTLGVGNIPIIPFHLPGSVELGESIKSFVGEYRCMVLARHGALSFGETIMEAYNGIERLEHAALTLKYAKEIEGITYLSDEEFSKVKELRKGRGNKNF